MRLALLALALLLTGCATMDDVRPGDGHAVLAPTRTPLGDPDLLGDMPSRKSVLPEPARSPGYDASPRCKVGSAGQPPAHCYCQSLGSYWPDVRLCPEAFAETPAQPR